MTAETKHTAPSCATCKYFDAGSCRRLPPSMVPWPTDNQHPVFYMPAVAWPDVQAFDWCGEWAITKAEGRS